MTDLTKQVQDSFCANIRDELIVHQHYIHSGEASRVEPLAVGNAVREGNPLFISITLGNQGTSIYIDGVLSKTFAKRGTSANNLTGRLVVADATEGRDSWPGIMASGGWQ